MAFGTYQLPVFLQKLVFISCILTIVFTDLISSPVALGSGLIVGVLVGNPFINFSVKASKYVLQAAVVGLGFGINLFQVAETGLSGIVYTFATLAITMLLGMLIGKKLGVSPKLTHLISAGTAICGGSAIAAVAPSIKASAHEISVALGIVFVLNALALFTFPAIGYALNLSQHQFGMWAAIAIHDTSSVVGAASKYGNEALQLATTLKLTRALWIVPMVLVSTFIFKGGNTKLSIPIFILLFLLASVLITFVPAITVVAPHILFVAKKGLILSLFLIGANLTLQTLRTISVKPFYHGVLIWLIIASSSLAVIYYWAQ